MPTFNYRAKDDTGNTVTGVVEADSEGHAAGMIREMGRWPMEIRPAARARPGAPSGRRHGLAHYLVHPIWTGVNIRQLLFFYRQLATLLGSGMGLSEALTSAGKRTGGRLGRIVREAADTVQRGRPMSETLSSYPRIFSPLQLSLLRAGEAGGLLQQMIERIAEYLESDLTIRRRIASATFYPKLLFFGILVIPLAPVLVLSGLVPFLHALVYRTWAPALGLIALVIGLKLLFQFDAVRLVWDYVKLLIPVLGWTARKIAMARFSRALAVLYSAGLSMSEAVSIAAEACANIHIGRLARGAVSGLREGMSLVESLGRSGAVTPVVMDMLATGEKSGAMDVVLVKAADYMEQESDMTLQKLGPVLFVVLVLIGAVLVGMQVLAGWRGYANLIEQGAGQ